MGSAVMGGSVKESFTRVYSAESLSRVRVIADYGNVQVVGEDRENIAISWKIDYRSDSLESVTEERSKIRYDVSAEAAECRMIFEYKDPLGGWLSMWMDRRPRFDIDVRVPTEMAIAIETRVGHIEVEGIQGNLEAETTGGRIDIEDVVGDLRVSSTGGSIDIGNVSGAVVAKTSGGGISIEGGIGRIIAETTGGSIRLECPDPTLERIDLSTMGGSIHIELSESLGGDVELKTRGGSVSMDDHWEFFGERRRNYVSGSFGKGDAIVRAITLGGSVRLDTL